MPLSLMRSISFRRAAPRLFIVALEKSLVPTKRHQYYLFTMEQVLDPARENPEPFEGALAPGGCSKNSAAFHYGLNGFRFVCHNCRERTEISRSTLTRMTRKTGSAEWRVKKHLAEMHPTHLRRVRLLKNGDTVTVGTIYRRVREGKRAPIYAPMGLAGCLRTPRGGSRQADRVHRRTGPNSNARWMSLTWNMLAFKVARTIRLKSLGTKPCGAFGDAVCVPVLVGAIRN